MSSKLPSAAPTPSRQQNISFQATNNRIASGNGATYDSAGNVIQDGNNSYVYYDAENRVVNVNGIDLPGPSIALSGVCFSTVLIPPLDAWCVPLVHSLIREG